MARLERGLDTASCWSNSGSVRWWKLGTLAGGCRIADQSNVGVSKDFILRELFHLGCSHGAKKPTSPCCSITAGDPQVDTRHRCAFSSARQGLPWEQRLLHDSTCSCCRRQILGFRFSCTTCASDGRTADLGGGAGVGGGDGRKCRLWGGGETGGSVGGFGFGEGWEGNAWTPTRISLKSIDLII